MNGAFWLMILALLMNGFIGMAQLAFDTPLVQNGGLINFDTIIQQQKELAEQAGSTTTEINVALSFGNFLKGTQFIINAVTLQYFADIVQAIINAVNISTGSGAEITTMFMWMVRAVMAAFGIFSIYYMLTGRGTTASA